MNPKIIYFVAGLVWGFLLTYLLIEVKSDDFSTATPIQAKETIIYKEKPTYPNHYELEVLTSEYRIKNKRNALKHDEALCEIANKRLDDIKNDFSHDGFEKHGRPSIFNRMGENLVTGFTNSLDAFNSWKFSPTHNENLLRPQYTSTCVKCSESYCVQLFGG